MPSPTLLPLLFFLLSSALAHPPLHLLYTLDRTFTLSHTASALQISSTLRPHLLKPQSTIRRLTRPALRTIFFSIASILMQKIPTILFNRDPHSKVGVRGATVTKFSALRVGNVLQLGSFAPSGTVPTKRGLAALPERPAGRCRACQRRR